MIITLTEKGLYLPTKEVAMLVASDWEAQEGLVSFAKLPLVRFIQNESSFLLVDGYGVQGH